MYSNSVVTAAKGLDNVSYPNRKIRHIVYPLLDSKAENITALFNRFYDLVEECIAVGSILVHCAAGISRVYLADLSLRHLSSLT